MKRAQPNRRRWIAALVAPIVAAAGCGGSSAAPSSDTRPADSATVSEAELLDYRSLDGSGNNPDDATLGQAGSVYPRVTDANYADGIGEARSGPPERYLSNRIFNDSNQNVFSENSVTHWSFVWGQFIDHTIGLREVSDEDLTITFDPDDPLESFTNDLGAIGTTRSAAADGTGEDSVREQVNTVSSYIDAWAVYGGSAERLDWLRDGSVDGDPTNNDATLIDADGYLPTAAARSDAEAPDIDLMGRLFADPTDAVVAGDVRVNENIGLTAVHTLFLREHNRIVDALPDDLDEETKFELARRVVSALQQYITYEEFLPAMGVDLDPYGGYDTAVDPSISNEFATVGYRAHSQIHGEFEAEIPRSELTDDDLAALEAEGVEVDIADDAVEVAVPLNVAFGNPELLTKIGLGNMLAGLSSEAAYANDEQIDNQLRSVLFQIPGPDTENPLDCLDGEGIEECFSGVNDLGALDVIRSYDHGMPTYNEMREAYGLAPITSFAELTGESTEDFPDDPEIDGADPIDDPDILDFVTLADADGNDLEPGSDAADTETVTAVRRTTTAARLKAIFGDVDEIDAFTGMVSEPHVAGTEFGELQLAMWETQFQVLRDGDRLFYGNDPVLEEIKRSYEIDYQRTLAQVITDNTDIDRTELPADVFVLDTDDRAAAPSDAGIEPDNPSVDASEPTESAPDDIELSSTFVAEVWADNWFALSVNGEVVGEDSVPITTERSFNAESIEFEASYPLTIAIEAKDFKETDSGLEYIGEQNQQMGDGGIIAQITDTATGEVVAVTDGGWSVRIVHRAPLNTECENDEDPDTTCESEIDAVPAEWTSSDFDDSAWTSATTWSAADVGPKDGYEEIAWDPSAQLIWGTDLEVDNTVLMRLTVPA